jgi:hypothetical protein
MQEGLPKPQRAWLHLPKDPVLVHYAKQIKAERDHVLEDIMPAGQRDLFGRVTVSTNEYMPLMAVARMDSLIGEEETRGEGDAAAVVEPAVSLHEQKQDLRDLHRLLVASVARNSGIDRAHREPRRSSDDGTASETHSTAGAVERAGLRWEAVRPARHNNIAAQCWKSSREKTKGAEPGSGNRHTVRNRIHPPTARTTEWIVKQSLPAPFFFTLLSRFHHLEPSIEFVSAGRAADAIRFDREFIRSDSHAAAIGTAREVDLPIVDGFVLRPAEAIDRAAVEQPESAGIVGDRQG